MIEYTKVKVPDGGLKLSPSGLSKFRSNPKEWLLNMNGKSTFNGNYSSVLGTCIHYVFESNFEKRTRAKVMLDIAVYLEQEHDNDAITQDEVDDINKLIDTTFYDACNAWLATSDEYEVVTVEPTVCSKVPYDGETANDYYIAGSIDAVVSEPITYQVLKDKSPDIWEDVAKSEYINAINSGVATREVCTGTTRSPLYGIRDYKTSKAKQSDLDKHKLQLITYALAWNATHPKQHVSFIEMVNVYNTKTKGVQINSYTYDFNVSDVNKLIEYYAEIVKSHQTAIKYPQIKDLLFRDGVDFRGRTVL